ncbi:MAG: alpha-mannosidase [Clostridia bacterium]|nr:alpha-mannosidase [Clostridia bacterium]
MYFAEKKFRKRALEMATRRYVDMVDIPSFEAMDDTLGNDEVHTGLPERIEGYEFKKNDFFVGRDRYLWLDRTVRLPEKKEGYDVVGFFDFGRTGDGFNSAFESLLYVNGEKYQGVDTHHNDTVLNDYAGKETRLSFLLWTGLEGGGPHVTHYHQFRKAQIGYLHKAADEMYYFTRAIAETIYLMDDNDPNKAGLERALEHAFNEINWDEDKYHETVEKALQVLLDELDHMEKHTKVTANVVGHSHIDVAWLWRLKHTREKVQRTFSTVLRYLEEFDEYIFLHTSPQVYKDLKKDAPELFENIRKRVEEGRWETDGAMWLEADCNITSGESLARQLQHGIRFFEKEFGKRSSYLWLPDVFGYSWALPQLLKQAGIDTFATTKISWNQFNSMPNDLFMWRGLDGSEIMTYFIDVPTSPDSVEERFSTYNGEMSAATTLGSWRRFKNKDISKDFLISYGWGDGGGGVDHDMLKMRRALDKLPGVPNVKPVKAGDFFKKVHDDIKKADHVPVWDGELYLEYHRGTYTSQGHNKRWNRKMEFLLKNTEGISALSYILGNSYRSEELYNAWEDMLELQFHDIIPGSSIREVYEDSDKIYEKTDREVREILHDSLKGLTEDEEGYFTVINPGTFNRSGLVFIPLKGDYKFIDEEGNTMLSQKSEEGYYVSVELKPFSFKNIIAKFHTPSVKREVFEYDGQTLETPFYTIRFGSDGYMDSIYDKENSREVLKGRGNALEIYEDKPMSFDNWDLDYFYADKKEYAKLLERPEVLENGKLLMKILFRFSYNNSHIDQIMTVYKENRRIDFDTFVDWHEDHRLLKVSFDVDIRTTKATYDIQYGHVERPTHYNTSWDLAKFEVVGHKWADVSEQNYGVALLNDCKYGYGIKDSKMTLSLLKSGKFPDTEADMGEHVFTYSLYPHRGNVIDGGVIKEGEALNQKLFFCKGRSILDKKSLFNIEGDGIYVDAIKKAEDDRGIIIRMHECYGGTQEVRIFSDYEIEDYCETNILEEQTGPVINKSVIEKTLRPFEIATYLVHLKGTN